MPSGIAFQIYLCIAALVIGCVLSYTLHELWKIYRDDILRDWRYRKMMRDVMRRLRKL